MPRTDITQLSDESRIWLFGISPALDAAKSRRLLDGVDAFLADWNAHGQPIRAAREIREGSFLVIAVDKQAETSGCSIDRMFGTLRSAHGVPTQMVLTGNPGGPGQHWIAARYKLIPFPLTPIVFDRMLSNGKRHRVATIPARIHDNKILLAKDPGYLDRLRLVGGPAEHVAAEADGKDVEVGASERSHVSRR